MRPVDVGLAAASASVAYLCRRYPRSLRVPWIKNVLMVGWWGVVAVMVASVFFFGAIVGGFK